MNLPTSCQYDTDCPSTLVCYQNISWAEEANIVCGCSGWFGWELELDGEPRCTKFGFQTVWSLIVNMMMVKVSFWGMCFGVYAIIKLLQHRHDIKLLNASNTTALYSTFGLFCMFAWRVVAFITLLQPEGYLRVSEDQSYTKFHNLTPENRVFATLSILFTTLAATNVGVMWIEVAQSSSKIRRTLRSSFSKLKIVVFVVQAVFALVLVLLMAQDRPDLGTLVAFPILFMVAVAIVVGQFKMKRLLQAMSGSGSASGATGSSSNSRNYKTIINKIQVTSSLILLFIILGLVSGAIYAYLNMDNWRNHVRPGKLGPVVIFNEIVIASLLAANVVIQWYCFDNMRTTWRRLEGRGPLIASTSKQNDMSSFGTLEPKSKQAGTHVKTTTAWGGPSSFSENIRSFHHTGDASSDDGMI